MGSAPSRRGWTTLIGSALALGVLFTLSGCEGRDQAEAQAPAPSEVVATSPVPADPVTTEAAPTTEPVATIEPAPSTEPVPSAAPTPTEPPVPVAPPPTTEVAEGIVWVLGIVDGDTIKVRIDGESTRVRIIGLDAPELGECGYQEGASVVQSLTQSREVRIEADPTQLDTDAYGRLLRHVFTLDGVNVAEEVIARGFAVEYTYDQPYAYRDDHLAAQARAPTWASGARCASSPRPRPA